MTEIKRATAWSYSAVSDFETCPAKFKFARIDKIPTRPTPALEKGIRVHGTFEKYLKGEASSLGEYSALQPYCDMLKANGAVAEKKVAFNKDWEVASWMGKDAWYRGAFDVIWTDGDGHTTPRTEGLVLDWKGLALETALPTPTGWTTMQDVQVGDYLLSSAGLPTRVVGKSAVKNIKCYKVVFDNATSVVCDAEHLWATTSGVVPVQELTNRHRVMFCAPLELPAAPLPIHPYVLGAWLGDGKHTSGEITHPDADIPAEIQRLGYEVSHQKTTKCPVYSVLGLRRKLDELGVLGNKHVPAMYLRASVEQRLSLLRGLMDTDGSWNKKRKQATFYSTDTGLANAVYELAASLGERPYKATVTSKGFGLTVQCHVVSWAVRRFNPFFLPRKANLVIFARTQGTGVRTAHCVRSVIAVDSVPTQCVSVDSTDSTYLCGKAMIPTHNTGNIYGSNESQMELFALALMNYYTTLEVVETRLCYVEHGGKEITNVYTRKAERDLKRSWTATAETILNCQDYAPRPDKHCNWCQFSGRKGGPCKAG